MVINLNQDVTVNYTQGGYGSFVISLTKGENAVSDGLGQFVIDTMPEVIAAEKKSKKNADPVPEEAVSEAATEEAPIATEEVATDTPAAS